MKRYKQGDRVWCASFGVVEKRETCPVCFGKKQVHIILGDDSCIACPCEFCKVGFDGPYGTIQTYEREARSEEHTIAEVRIREDVSGEDVEYVTVLHRLFRPQDVFDNQDEAQRRADVLAEEATAREFEALLRRKSFGETDRTYTWGIGYHKREAARHRKDAEYHERLCATCKERARPRTANAELHSSECSEAERR